jgi:hypothetical protein
MPWWSPAAASAWASPAPATDIHYLDGDTPTLRLDQAGGGFTAQTWDVAGNEANFFIRDVTGGSRLSFRIQPGAPTSTLDISASGNVGIGTASPAASLHVRRVSGSGATAAIRVEEASATPEERNLISITNNGNSIIAIENASSGSTWRFGNLAGDFQMTKNGTGVIEFRINAGGDAEFAGDVTANGVLLTSSREMKENFAAVDSATVLDQLAGLQIGTWRFKNDPAVHMGPIAEDFATTFGLGDDDRRISVTDASGVALKAIQGLLDRLEETEKALEHLQAENSALAERLGAVEAVASTHN